MLKTDMKLDNYSCSSSAAVSVGVVVLISSVLSSSHNVACTEAFMSNQYHRHSSFHPTTTSTTLMMKLSSSRSSPTPTDAGFYWGSSSLSCIRRRGFLSAGSRRRRVKDKFETRTSISLSFALASSSSSTVASSNDYDSNDKTSSSTSKFNNLFQTLTMLTPLWTMIAAMIGWNDSSWIASTIGSTPVVSKSLFTLMFAMALSTTPSDFTNAIEKSPLILGINAIGCFGLMPILAILTSRILNCNSPETIGTLLLGCVCGGQASNLFALLAGGMFPCRSYVPCRQRYWVL